MASSLTFFVLAFAAFIAFGKSAVINPDMAPLIALKEGLRDPENVMKDWDPAAYDPCTWVRVECNGDGRAIEISLSAVNLGGRISPELGKLDALQRIYLDRNHIEGPIPPSLGNLRNLVILELWRNRLTGTIPASLGNLKSIDVLRLNDNQLTGTVPPSVRNLGRHIRMYNVSGNHLTGPPASFVTLINS